MVVDDSEQFRVSVRRLLAVGGIAIVAEAADCRHALQAVKEHDPDVVLVDVGLGGESGFDLAKCIDSSPVIMMSSSFDPHEIEAMMADTPAIGFLPKHELSAESVKNTLTQHT